MKNNIAKGSWQKQIWNDLLAGYAITNPVSGLVGTAKSYAGKYHASFTNLLHRARTAGYIIQRIPGSRGGEWSATYQIIAEPLKVA